MLTAGPMLKQVLDGDKRIHRTRVKNLAWASGALALGGRLSLTGIGRSARGPTRAKHRIKRTDRLLGNRGLHGAIRGVFAAISDRLLSGLEQALILVDWTRLDNRFCALSAMLAHSGRSIPLYHESHPASAYGNGDTEAAFLEALAELVPSSCRAILVTDAGFRNPWFIKAVELGFDVVGRLTPNVNVRPAGRADGWRSAREVGEGAASPADLDVHRIGKTGRVELRVVHAGPYTPATPRKRRKPTQKNRAGQKARRMNRLPWVLATTLDNDWSHRQVLNLYARRMEIEESFRDLKGSRFGWSLNHARPGTKERWDILLLVASCTLMVLQLIGRIAERRRWHHHFQANTVRAHRVLSLTTLAEAVLRCQHYRSRLRSRDFIRELERMRRNLEAVAKGGEQ